MQAAPAKKYGVIFSSSTHEANIMVVIGLKYTQLVAFTAPNLEIHQFQVKKQIMEAKQPKNKRFPITCGRVKISSEGHPGINI